MGCAPCIVVDLKCYDSTELNNMTHGTHGEGCFLARFNYCQSGIFCRFCRMEHGEIFGTGKWTR